MAIQLAGSYTKVSHYLEIQLTLNQCSQSYYSYSCILFHDIGSNFIFIRKDIAPNKYNI